MMYEMINARNERFVIGEDALKTARSLADHISFVDGVERFVFLSFHEAETVAVAWPQGELTA